MLSSLVAVTLAATAADAVVEAHAGAAAQSEAPLIVARADGGWTITRAIHEDPAALAAMADGLRLADVADERFTGGLGEREALREIEMEDQFERAFEEAIDKAHEAAPPQ